MRAMRTRMMGAFHAPERSTCKQIVTVIKPLRDRAPLRLRIARGLRIFDLDIVEAAAISGAGLVYQDMTARPQMT